MKHLKSFRIFEKTAPLSLLDKVQDVLKGGIKKGGMYFITQSKPFKELTRLKDIQQQRLDKEIKKYGETMTIGGEAAQEMVNMYNQNLNLLDSTIDQYVSRKINNQQVIATLDKKIKEVQSKPTLGLKDAEAFKKAALDLLTWLKSDVSPWLI